MDKEVLIHVRGLQTMDADGEQEPLEIVVPGDRKSTRLNSSHTQKSRMPSSA